MSRELKSYIAILLILSISFSSNLIPYEKVKAEDQFITSTNPLVQYPSVCELHPTTYEHTNLPPDIYNACGHLKTIYDAALREYLTAKEIVKFTDIGKYGNPLFNCRTQCGLGFGGAPLYSFPVDICAAVLTGGNSIIVELASNAKNIYDSIRDIWNSIAKASCWAKALLGDMGNISVSISPSFSITATGVEEWIGPIPLGKGGLLGRCGIGEQLLHIISELKDCVGPYFIEEVVNKIEWDNMSSIGDLTDSPLFGLFSLLNYVQDLAATTSDIVNKIKEAETNLGSIDSALLSPDFALDASQTASTSLDVGIIKSFISTTSFSTSSLESISSTAKDIKDCAGCSGHSSYRKSKVFADIQDICVYRPLHPSPSSVCDQDVICPSSADIQNEIKNYIGPIGNKIKYLKGHNIGDASGTEEIVERVKDYILSTSSDLDSSTTDLKNKIVSDAENIYNNSGKCGKCSDTETIQEKAEYIEKEINSFADIVSKIANAAQELVSIAKAYKIKASSAEGKIEPIKKGFEDIEKEYFLLQTSFFVFYNKGGGEPAPACEPDTLAEKGDRFSAHDCQDLEEPDLSGTCITSTVATTIDCFINKLNIIKASTTDLINKLQEIKSADDDISDEINSEISSLIEKATAVSSTIEDIKSLTKNKLQPTLRKVESVFKAFDFLGTLWDIVSRLIIPPTISVDIGTWHVGEIENQNNIWNNYQRLMASTSQCTKELTLPELKITTSESDSLPPDTSTSTNPTLFKCTSGECTNYKGGKTIFPDLSLGSKIIKGAHYTIRREIREIENIIEAASPEEMEALNKIKNKALKIGGQSGADMWIRYLSKLVVNNASQSLCGQSLCFGMFCYTGIPAACNWSPSVWYWLLTWLLSFPLNSAADYLGEVLSSPD